MTSSSRQLHLNAFLMTIGHHESARRFPESSLLGAWDIQHSVHLARVAERGTFDSIFFGDGPALQGDAHYRPVGRLDSTALLPALAAVTERIGLVATASTTYNEPYNLARRFASIDHIRGGHAELARREKLTVRELLVRLGGGRGHRTFTGTPEQVTDTIEQWFQSSAADGFNVMAPLLPSGLEAFVDHVVPELRRRGLFRHEYAGRTLREHYGLDKPSSQYALRQTRQLAAAASN